MPFSRENVLIVIGVLVVFSVVLSAWFIIQSMPSSTTTSSSPTTTSEKPSSIKSSIPMESTMTSTTQARGYDGYYIVAYIYARDNVESRQGVLRVITVVVDISVEQSINLYVDKIFVDNLTKNHPLYENLTLQLRGSERFVAGGSTKRYVLQAYITREHSELMSQWNPGTIHNVYVVFRIGNEQKVEILRVAVKTTTETIPWTPK